MRLEIAFESSVPVYIQIVEQIKRLIAGRRLRAGEQLPTVRELAKDLAVNPSTVAKAYVELEREGVIVTRRGGGSFVAARVADEYLAGMREDRLMGLLRRTVVEALSLGFEPEELEGAFALQIAAWRERRATRASGIVPPAEMGADKVLFVGSHDLALETLFGQLRRARPPLDIVAVYVGSLEGLIALERGEAHVAGAHLLDEENGEYNTPYIRRLLPGQDVVLVTMVERLQGLMVAKGNPRGIVGLEDVRRGLRFVNRQRGSGTRVLLDHKLRQLGISPTEIAGYNREETTHLAVAAAVADGSADVGLGIYAAARSLDLDFLPLVKERYDLVMLRDFYEGDLVRPLLSTLRGDEFRRVVAAMGGYDVSQSGLEVAVTKSS